MKVVFDTNIFISALTLPGGRGDQALARIIEGEDSLAFSKPILDELLSVLARKFAHEREGLARVAVFLSSIGELVRPDEPVATLSDEPDNRILECALAASAQCIVTGDRAVLALREFRGIRIVSLSDYLGPAGLGQPPADQE
ncbi:MAG: putative toxin-antitoxin system toxin component, PIN family [Gammaproteobacteria bacterium]